MKIISEDDIDKDKLIQYKLKGYNNHLNKNKNKNKNKNDFINNKYNIKILDVRIQRVIR